MLIMAYFSLIMERIFSPEVIFTRTFFSPSLANNRPIFQTPPGETKVSWSRSEVLIREASNFSSVESMHQPSPVSIFLCKILVSSKSVFSWWETGRHPERILRNQDVLTQTAAQWTPALECSLRCSHQLDHSKRQKTNRAILNRKQIHHLRLSHCVNIKTEMPSEANLLKLLLSRLYISNPEGDKLRFSLSTSKFRLERK